MTRITEAQLQSMCDRINRTLGTPLAAYTKQADGTYAPNANAYLIEYAYGGTSLQQMMPTGTGQRAISGGFRPKRELLEFMHAFLAGVGAAREVQS